MGSQTKMSDKDLSSIPNLKDGGGNYVEWASLMKAILMSLGLWDAINVTNKPVPSSPPTAAELKEASDWKKMDQKVQGYILRKVDRSIAVKIDTGFELVGTAATGETGNSISVGPRTVANHKSVEVSAANMWEYLRVTYGTTSVTSIFMEYQRFHAIRVPSKADPTAALDRITASYQKLASYGVILGDFVLAMTFVAALPAEYGGLPTFLAGKTKVLEVKSGEARDAITQFYRAGKDMRPLGGAEAHRISAVKGNPPGPSFCTQTRASGSGNGSGSGNNRPSQSSQQHTQSKDKGKQRDNSKPRKQKDRRKKGKASAHNAEADSDSDGEFGHAADTGPPSPPPPPPTAHTQVPRHPLPAKPPAPIDLDALGILPKRFELFEHITRSFGIPTRSRDYALLAGVCHRAVERRRDDLVAHAVSQQAPAPFADVETPVTSDLASRLSEAPRVQAERIRKAEERALLEQTGAWSTGLPVSSLTSTHRDLRDTSEQHLDAPFVNLPAGRLPPALPDLGSERARDGGLRRSSLAGRINAAVSSPVNAGPRVLPSESTSALHESLPSPQPGFETEDERLDDSDWYDYDETLHGRRLSKRARRLFGRNAHVVGDAPVNEPNAYSAAAIGDIVESYIDMEAVEDNSPASDDGTASDDTACPSKRRSSSPAPDDERPSQRTWHESADSDGVSVWSEDQTSTRPRRSSARVERGSSPLKRGDGPHDAATGGLAGSGPTDKPVGRRRGARGTGRRGRRDDAGGPVLADRMNTEYVNPCHGEVLADDAAVDLFPASGSRSLYLYSACTESIFMCSHNREVAACSACKGKSRASGAITPWLIDSGASKHFTNCISDFVHYEPWSKARQQKLTTANGQSRIVGEGSVIIRAKNSSGKYCSVRLSHVQYVPDLTTRLLSLGTFLRSGMTVTGDGDRLILRHKNREYMVFEHRAPRDTLYGVNSKEFTEITAMAAKTVGSVTYDTMHQRFAHPASEVLKHARKHTKGFPDVVPSPPGICPGCAKGKMANRSYPASDARASAPFDLVHSDLKSYPIAGVHKNVYVMTFFDDHTSYAWIKFLKLKSDSIKALRQFIRMVKTQYGADIKRWCCDQGGEYLSKEFEDVLADHGIKLTPSPPYTPQVNGRTERFMRTMDEKAACMRHYAGTPNSWWEFAVEYAVHIYNLTPLQRHKWKTPHEALCKEKPTIDHLRVFGCGAYIFVPAKTRENKMAPKAELMTFVGWGSSGYKFVTRSGALRHQPHALFDESIFPRSKDTSTLQDVTRLHDAPNDDETVVDNLPDIPIGPGDGIASRAPQLPPVQRTVFDSSDGSSEPISAPVPGTGLPATPERTSRRKDPVTPWTPYTRPSSPPQRGKNVRVETIAPDHDSPVQPLALRREPRDRKNITKPNNAWGESRPALDKSTFTDFRLAVNDFEPTQKAGPSRPNEASRIPVRSPVPGPAPRSPVLTRLRQAVREAQPLPMPPLSSGGISLEHIANNL
jgi:hypothetical protein